MAKETGNPIADMISKGTADIVAAKRAAQRKEFEQYEAKYGIEHPEKEKYEREIQRKEGMKKSKEDVKILVALLDWEDAIKNTIENPIDKEIFEYAKQERKMLDLFKDWNNHEDITKALMNTFGYTSAYTMRLKWGIEKEKREKEKNEIANAINEGSEKIRQRNEMKEVIREVAREFKNG